MAKDDEGKTGTPASAPTPEEQKVPTKRFKPTGRTIIRYKRPDGGTYEAPVRKEIADRIVRKGQAERVGPEMKEA